MGERLGKGQAIIDCVHYFAFTELQKLLFFYFVPFCKNHAKCCFKYMVRPLLRFTD